MAYQLVIDDSFQRADTAPVPAGTTGDAATLGNGWVGRGGYQIKTDRLYVYGGDNNQQYPLDSACRPAAENFQNGRAIVRCKTSDGGSPGIALRATAGNGGGYGAVLYGAALYLSKGAADSNPSTWTGTQNTGVTIPAAYAIELIAASTSPTQTQVVVNLYDQATLNASGDPTAGVTPLYTYAGTDSTAALQVPGAAGVCYYSFGVWDRFQSYQVVAGPPSAGAVSGTAYKTVVALTVAAPTGGSGALAGQWYRSTAAGFAPSPATLVAGATGLTLNDSGLTPGTTYDYVYQVTDAAGAKSSSAGFAATTLPANGHVIGFVGDSITYGTGSSTANGPQVEQAALAAAGVPVGILNRGVFGSTTGGWLSTYLAPALAAFEAVACDTISIMLGINDVTAGGTAAAYGANLQAIIAQCLATPGVTQVILNSLTYGGHYNSWTAATVALEQTYLPVIQSVAATTPGVRLGDTTAYAFFLNNPQDLNDGLHPNQAGYNVLGAAWAAAAEPYLTATLAPVPTAVVVNTPSTVTLTPAGATLVGTAPLSVPAGSTVADQAVARGGAGATATVTAGSAGTLAVTAQTTMGPVTATLTVTPATMTVYPNVIPAGSPQTLTVDGAGLLGRFAYGGTSGTTITQPGPAVRGGSTVSATLVAQAARTGTLTIADAAGPALTVQVVAAQPGPPVVVPGSGSATITWAAAAGAATYVLYRTPAGGPPAQVYAGPALTYADAGLTNGTAYAYTVVAVDAAGDASTPSAGASATPAVPVRPPGQAVDVTPSDAADLPFQAREIRATFTGTVAVVPAGQSAPVTIPVAAGVPLVFPATRILATGTTPGGTIAILS